MNEIRKVIETKATLLSEGDAAAVLAHYAPGFVEFNLAPPLRQPGDGRDPAPLQAWLSTFESPPVREVTRLEITASGDVAFATGIDRLTATPKGGDSLFTLWFRVTLGLRRLDGRWLVTHEHESVPFEMDGSFQASTNLTPAD